MTNHTHASVPTQRVRGLRWLTWMTAVFAVAVATSAPAQAPQDLEKLVARIALYPDDLIGIILPAATNPLQLVQADRYLDKRKADPKLPVDEKLDDAVKSLLNYPEVVKTMSNDLDWTVDLGEAVVADQGAVLEAIQAFRRKTQAAGNLKSDAKQVVVIEKEIIRIVPADPQVIYVPQYDPATVVVYGGYSTWGYWPTAYPVYYYPYPPGAALVTGLIWGAAIGAAWNGGHYVTHYGSSGNININRNTNINTGNINTGNVNRPSQMPAGGNSQWNSGKRPGQVSSSIGRNSAAGVGYSPAGGFNSAAGVGYSPTGGFSSGGAGRPSNQTPGGNSGSSAFGGMASGAEVRMDSSRGAASRGAVGGPQFSRSFGGGGRGGRR